MARISVDFTARSQMGAALQDIAKVRASLAALAVDMQTLGKTDMSGMRSIEKDFIKNVNALKQFETMQVRTRTTTQKLTDDIIKQKVAMKDMANVRRNLTALAKEQDRLNRSSAAITSRGPDGRVAGHLIQPMADLADKTRLARIEQGILGQAMASAGQQAIKAGKNMQWSGRQLMSGFSAPIGLAAGAAAKFAYDIDASMVRLTKVYGDLSGASEQELQQVRDDTMATAKAVARDFGIAGTETVKLAAEFAAAGRSGKELQEAVRETARISTLGELDRQKAMQSTITIQTVFGHSTAELADKFNFLNAVENQTNTTLQDLTEVIPRTASVVKDLGGTLEDSAIFTVAFKEAGIDAVQGANALRSSLGAIVAPSGVASKKLQGLGINMAELVEKNRPEKGGSIIGLLTDLGNAMSELGSVERQQAMSVLFGRYQFNKMGGLLKGVAENANNMNTQVGRAFSLTRASTEELSAVAERELNQMSESLSGRLVRALREAQIEFAEFGRPILAIAVEIMEVINGFVGALNAMPKPLKVIAGIMAGGLFVAGPIIYILGLFKNMYGQLFRLAGMMLKTKGASKEMLTPQGVFATQAESQVVPAIQHETNAFMLLQQQIDRTIGSISRLNAEQAKIAGAGLSAGTTAGRARHPKGAKDASGKSIAGQFIPLPSRASASTLAIAGTPDRMPSRAVVMGGETPANAKKLSDTLGTAKHHMNGIVSGVALLTSALMAASGATGPLAVGIQTALLGLMIYPQVIGHIGKGVSALAGKVGLVGKAGPGIARVTKLFGAMRMAIMGALGPIGWIAGGLLLAFGLYKAWQKHLENIRKETRAVANSAQTMSQIVGYDYAVASEAGRKAGVARIKTLQDEAEAWANSGEQAKIAAKKFREAKTATEAIKMAYDVMADALAHGATREQAEKSARIGLAASGMQNWQIDEAINDPRNQFQSLVSQTDGLKVEFDRIGEEFGKTLVFGMGKGVKADTAMQEYGKKFAAQFDPNNMQEFFEAFDQLGPMVQEKSQKLIEELDIDWSDSELADLGKLGIDPKNAETAKAFFSDIGESVANLDEEGHLAYQSLVSTSAGFSMLDEAASKAAHSEMRLVDALKTATKTNTEQNKSVDTLAEFERLYAGSLVRTMEAQALYNEHLHMNKLSHAELSDAEQLKLLNTYRAMAQLPAAAKLTDAFGASSAAAAQDVTALANALSSMDPKQFVQSLQGNLKETVTSATGSLTTAYDEATQAGKESAEENNRAWQNSFDARSKAAEKAAKAEADKLEETQRVAKKTFDKRQANEVEALENMDKVRERLFQAEMTRIERLAEAANANIDFNVALNSGNLDEAARIANAAYVTDVSNTMDDAALGADDASAVRRKALDARHELEQEAFDASQKRAKDALDAKRQHEKDMLDAEKDRHDEAFAASQRRYDKERSAQRKNLEDQLKNLTEFVPKNKAEYDKLFKDMSKMATDFGLVAHTKTEEWTTMNRDGLRQAYNDTFAELSDAAAWTKLGSSSMESLAEGMLGMTFDEFATWMATGNMPKTSPKSVDQRSKAEYQAKKPTNMSMDNWMANYTHSGGPAGANSGRAGRPMNAPLYPDEVPTVLQKGEYVWDKQTVKNVGIDNIRAVHRNKGRGDGLFFHKGGMVGVVGAGIMNTMAGAMAAAMQAGAKRKAQELYATGDMQNIPQQLMAQASQAGIVGPEYAKSILNAIKMHESGGNYRAQSPISTASGAYQYINGTWNGYRGFPTAASAPPEIQDERAMSDLMAAYNKFLDWSKAIAHHFYPAWANRPDLWNRSPSEGNPTVQQYVNSIMEKAGIGGAGARGEDGFAPHVDTTGRAIRPDVLSRVLTGLSMVPGRQEIISGFRPGSIVAGTSRLSLHAEGKAADIGANAYDPIQSAMGDRIASVFRSGKIPGVSEVLWKTMTGGNHFDHVHVGFRHGGGGIGIPGLKTGGSVNYDNTLANLHKGEKVLTAPLSASLERGIQNMDNSRSAVYNINVHGAEGQSVKALAREVRLELQRTEVAKGINRRVD